MENTETIELLQKSFHDFKENHARELEEVKKNGSADVLSKIATEKANEAVTDLEVKMNDQIQKMQAMVNRQQAAEEAEEKADRAGVEYKEAYNAYIRKGTEGGLVAKALSVGSDPDGGYTVTPEMGGMVMTQIFESTPMRSLASVQVISTDSLEFILDDDEFASAKASETGSRAETATATLGKKSIPVHEYYASPKATQKLLDDSSVNIESWIAQKLAAKFGRAEATDFITGSGVDSPTGLLTNTSELAGAFSATDIEFIKSGSNGAFDYDDVITLALSLKDEYARKGSWLMSRSSVSALRKLTDGNNQYIWQPNTVAGSPSTIEGRPLFIGEDMPDPATDSLSIAFGDFARGYQIVDRKGITILRDPFSSKPFITFYATKRTGGDVLNAEAIKLLKLSA